MSEFSDLKGKTLTSVKNIDDESIMFITSDGKKYEMFHYQHCCETVVVEDICGELDNILNAEILVAEERTSDENPKQEEYIASFTWTFYELATIKGAVTIRWWGESNGYYSEEVDFEEVK